MALPKVNVLPSFELTIPSTGKRERFRPYLVKEEKILLLAMESKDMKQMVDSMIDTIKSCCESDMNVEDLTTFDVEYIFTKIRAKSVGEIVKIQPKCDNMIKDSDGSEHVCGHKNEISINIEAIEMNMPKVDKIMKITDKISLELKWPRYREIMSGDLFQKEKLTADEMFTMITKCISAVLTPEERFDAKDSTDEELVEFVESLTTAQLKGITDFIEKMPKMQFDVQYECEACGKKHDLLLEGMHDFF